MIRAYVWIFPLRREILVTEDPSPIAEPSAMFAKDFPVPPIGWGEAGIYAEKRAKELVTPLIMNR